MKALFNKQTLELVEFNTPETGEFERHHYEGDDYVTDEYYVRELTEADEAVLQSLPSGSGVMDTVERVVTGVVLPADVPLKVSARQLKLQLFTQGDLDTIDSVVAQQARAIQIEWETATEFERTWETLGQMVAYLATVDAKWDDAYVDQTFIDASKL